MIVDSIFMALTCNPQLWIHKSLKNDAITHFIQDLAELIQLYLTIRLDSLDNDQTKIRKRLSKYYIQIIQRLPKDYIQIIQRLNYYSLFPNYPFLPLRLCESISFFVCNCFNVAKKRQINCYKQLTTNPSLQTRSRNDYPKITFTHNQNAMVNQQWPISVSAISSLHDDHRSGRPTCRPCMNNGTKLIQQGSTIVVARPVCRLFHLPEIHCNCVDMHIKPPFLVHVMKICTTKRPFLCP